MENLMTRRELLEKSMKAAAAFGTLGLLGSYAADPLFGQARSEAMETLSFEPQGICELTCSQTLGPCYAANPLVRQDITSGKPGLPMKLGFRVLDTNCNPIQNASVDIWHTDNAGVYSALAGFCANGDASAPSQNFFRGVQLTNSDGWAYFDTMFPGWYPSRTTHIHATFRLNNTAIVTTQFYFLDRINKFVYKNHPNYLSRPNPQTVNTTDNILGGSIARMTPYFFATKFIPNKPLWAWKNVVLNTSPNNCNA